MNWRHHLASVSMAAVSHWQQTAVVPAAAAAVSIPLASFYSAAASYVLQAALEHQAAAAAAAVVETDLHPSIKVSQRCSSYSVFGHSLAEINI